MSSDIERTYTGTNFAVITLIVLLVLVGGYLLVAQGRDVADDQVSGVQRHSVVR